jgi:hypothetical protein
LSSSNTSKKAEKRNERKQASWTASNTEVKEIQHKPSYQRDETPSVIEKN